MNLLPVARKAAIGINVKLVPFLTSNLQECSYPGDLKLNHVEIWIRFLQAFKNGVFTWNEKTGVTALCCIVDVNNKGATKEFVSFLAVASLIDRLA